MNTIVRIKNVDGTIQVVEMANSQFCELTNELFDWDDRVQRKATFKALNIDKQSFTLKDGTNIKVVT